MPRQLFAQFGGYGFNPGQVMFMPMPGFNVQAQYDTSQIPVGWHGVKPVHWESDGTPVYAQMPVYGEVLGAFIAPVSFPLGDGRFWMPEQIRFPAKGRKRKKFIADLKKRLDDANRACREVCAMRNINGERAAEIAEAEIHEERYRQRQQHLRDKEHQRQLDLKDKLFYHMNDNQLQHYRDGWQPVVQPVGGLQYGTPDLMVAPYGNLYWIP